MRYALSFLVLAACFTAISGEIKHLRIGPILTSTVEGIAQGAAVQATPAGRFVDSIGVATHWSFPSYGAHTQALEKLLISCGIRHIRDGANPSAMQALAPYGIKETVIIDPVHGIVPDRTYWSGAPTQSTYSIADYLKNYMPPHSVDAVEMPNELDVFYKMYRWHPGDSASLSANKEDPNYYGAYGEAVTKDCWREIKSDPALRDLKVIGPTIGVEVPSPFAPGSLYNYVDWGGFHPYPGRSNTWTAPRPYGGIEKYYWNSVQPSVNVASDAYGGNPLMFTWYQPPFASVKDSKPMAATETGYQTARNGREAVSITAQAKYTPRLFAEYFRNGIPRTYLYEFFDEADDPNDVEKNFGLIYNNLTAKPAYTALCSLIHLLKDNSDEFNAGSLAYRIEAQPTGEYTRTGYIHDLLLQKKNGDFYLLLWHEVASSATTDANGKPIPGMQRDILPPAVRTRITFASPIHFARIYSYNASWQLIGKEVSTSQNSLALPVTDSLSVIQLR